jgi:hypothetical protein
MPEYGVVRIKFEQHRSKDEYHKETLDLRLADDAASAPTSVQTVESWSSRQERTFPANSGSSLLALKFRSKWRRLLVGFRLSFGSTQSGLFKTNLSELFSFSFLIQKRYAP